MSADRHFGLANRKPKPRLFPGWVLVPVILAVTVAAMGIMLFFAMMSGRPG